VRFSPVRLPLEPAAPSSPVLLHGGPLPGYRASHGCIRLPYGFAERIFDLTSVGTRVVIVPDRADALPVTHPLLERLEQSAVGATPASGVERAREAATSAVSGAATAAKKAGQARSAVRRAEAARDNVVKRLDAAVKRAEAQKTGPAKLRAEAQAAKLRDTAAVKMTDAEAAQKAAQAIHVDRIAAEARAREARSRAWPLSIMVSLKTQKIYVRRGFELLRARALPPRISIGRQEKESVLLPCLVSSC
jgi:L,D-transpeptidase catalytic domain